MLLLMLLTTAQTVLATDVDNLMFFKEQDTSTVNPDEPDGLVDPVDPANPTGTKKATAATAKRNNEWYNRLDFEDLTELQNAKRGLIEATPDLNITNANGEVWNMQSYKFLLNESGAPSTVNPSLWQNALCNVQCGLFQVCEGIYQVRGYDMANMSFIKTKNGWIIFDVLMCKEVAEAALDIFKRNIDSNPRIVAVLISHSHADHYGGVGAIVNAKNLADASLPLDQQLRPGKIAVITPEGFMKHVIAENAYCSAGMKRRAGYQYGADLPKGVTGRMAMGIGMGQSTNSPLTLMPPTFEVKNDTTVNFIIGNEKCAVVRRSGVVLTYIGETLPNADATARGSKSALVNYLNGNFTGLTISGSTQAVNSLFEGIQKPVTNFNIIEP